jgi:hypothetical protein
MTAPGPDVVAALAGATGDEAFSVLARWTTSVDWSAVPDHLPLADGARVRFERRRRQAVIDQVNGGTSVFDLGRPDRMRPVEAILTPDLTRVEGPSLTIASIPGRDWSEVALRDPLDRKGRRATTIAAPGGHATCRYVDADGTTRLLGFGALEGLTGFGTFLMDDGAAYARLRTTSGLACFYDARRAGLRNAVTDQVVHTARSEGFAEVVASAGVIGVLLDAGAPGDVLALAAYGGAAGGTVGIVVDLRRPPVKDGAIIDPPISGA